MLDAENRACKMRGMNTPRSILAYTGPDEEIAAALGVTVDRVQRAKRDPLLPAAWLDTLERRAGQPLPREAFSFKRAKA